jgi:hypothetical protein
VAINVTPNVRKQLTPMVYTDAWPPSFGCWARHTPKERVAAKEIEADLDNAEAAWRWAIEHGREEWLGRALGVLLFARLARAGSDDDALGARVPR